MNRKVEFFGVKLNVDSDGKIYDIFNNRVRTRFNKTTGRETVILVSKEYYTYRIIAYAFPEICGEWFDGCEVHHIDHNPQNNRAENLMVVTPEEHHLIHIEESISHLPDYKGQTDKKICQYSLNGEYIRCWKSAATAARSLHLKSSAITKAARGNSDTSGGYQWRYFDGDIPMWIESILPPKERTLLGNYTPISKYTKSGDWIKDYQSLKEAAMEIGIYHTGNIVNCLSGKRKSAYGFCWKYQN